MPKYSKHVPVSGKNQDEVYQVISETISGLLEKLSIGKFDLTPNDSNKTIDLKSKMVNATLFCEDGIVRIEGSLALMATPFKKKIDEYIDRWAQKNL